MPRKIPRPSSGADVGRPASQRHAVAVPLDGSPAFKRRFAACFNRGLAALPPAKRAAILAAFHGSALAARQVLFNALRNPHWIRNNLGCTAEAVSATLQYAPALLADLIRVVDAGEHADESLAAWYRANCWPQRLHLESHAAVARRYTAQTGREASYRAVRAMRATVEKEQGFGDRPRA